VNVDVQFSSGLDEHAKRVHRGRDDRDVGDGLTVVLGLGQDAPALVPPPLAQHGREAVQLLHQQVNLPEPGQRGRVRLEDVPAPAELREHGQDGVRDLFLVHGVARPVRRFLRDAPQPPVRDHLVVAAHHGDAVHHAPSQDQAKQGGLARPGPGRDAHVRAVVVQVGVHRGLAGGQAHERPGGLSVHDERAHVRQRERPRWQGARNDVHHGPGPVDGPRGGRVWDAEPRAEGVHETLLLAFVQRHGREVDARGHRGVFRPRCDEHGADGGSPAVSLAQDLAGDLPDRVDELPALVPRRPPHGQRDVRAPATGAEHHGGVAQQPPPAQQDEHERRHAQQGPPAANPAPPGAREPFHRPTAVVHGGVPEEGRVVPPAPERLARDPESPQDEHPERHPTCPDRYYPHLDMISYRTYSLPS